MIFLRALSRSGRVPGWGLALCGLLLSGPAAGAEEAHRRFLALYSQHSDLVANVEVTRGMTAVLGRELEADYEIYAEFRDGQRFPGAEEDRLFGEMMLRKYEGQRFDAILAFGGWALDYALANRAALGIDAPVVFGGVGEATLAGRALPGDVHGVTSGFSIPGTLALAQRLQPEARRVVAMFGSTEFDRSWEPRVRAAMADLPGLELEIVSGLTLEGFEAVAAGLGRDTILLVLTIFEDAAGRQFTPANAAAFIAERSGAPAWGVYDTYVGRGIVGGDVQRFRDVGAAAAEAAVALAAGAEVAPLRAVPSRPVVDWRAMQRFGLDRDRLPANAALEFYDPSAWERYRLQILAAAALVLLQSGTIAALALQGRRRRAAERDAAARRAEIAHVSRVAQLGELSGAMAHELNQPLAAILANAEAGAQLLSRPPADLEEIAAILADIAEDDRRAARLIVDLRRLMAGEPPEMERVDLNRMAETAVRLIGSELLMREVRADLRLAPEALIVRASRPQIKQVLLNLMLNAADAMAGEPAPRRTMTISTRRRADGWRELAVEDRGPGLDPAVAQDPFRPFVTTKPKGLGLGLSICRTIVQAHGGALAFDAGMREGARVVLALPPP